MYRVCSDGVVGHVRDGKIKLRAGLDNFFDAANEHALVCVEPTLAQQQFKEECDINTLVERFGLGYQVPDQGIRAPQYGDFTEVGDFTTCMRAVASARESFDALPASVRAEFNHDPAAFIAFAQDEKNALRCGELGLLAPGAYEARKAALEASAKAEFDRAVQVALRQAQGVASPDQVPGVVTP